MNSKFLREFKVFFITAKLAILNFVQQVFQYPPFSARNQEFSGSGKDRGEAHRRELLSVIFRFRYYRSGFHRDSHPFSLRFRHPAQRFPPRGQPLDKDSRGQAHPFPHRGQPLD